MCVGKEEEARVHQQMQMVAQKQVDEMRMEVSRREQELMQMSTKMKVNKSSNFILKKSSKSKSINAPKIGFKTRMKSLL